MKGKKRFWSIFLAMIMLISVVGCAQDAADNGDSSNSQNTEEEPLVIMTGASQVTLDPFISGSMAELNIIFHVAEPLLKFNGETLEIEPCLATEWENTAPTEWTFKLREGVKFHDGSDLTAEDVKFVYERIIAKQKDATLIGNYGYVQASAKFVSCEIVDSTTITLVTENPVPVLPLYVAEIFIYPAAYFDGKTDEQLQMEITGTGPYKFVEWKKDQYVALEKNDNYWGTPANIQKVMFKSAPESSTRVAELTTGGVHIIDKVSPDMQSQVSNGSHMNVLESGVRQYLGFVQYGHPVVQVKEFRQAMNYAVNLEAIIDNLLDGSVERTGVFVNPPWNNENVKAYPYDVEKAKELLVAAGLTDGNGNGILEYNGEDINLKILTPKGRYVKDVEVCQAIAADMGKVGINVEVMPMDWSVYVGQLDAKTLEGDMFFIGSGTSFEAQGDLSDVYPTNSSNYGQWKNDEFKALYDELAVTFDQEERRAISDKMQELMWEEAPMVFLYFQPSLYGISDKVEWNPRKDAKIEVTKAKFVQ